MFYKLNDDKSVSICMLIEWGQQICHMKETNTKHVADEEVNGKRISTVWVGLDQRAPMLGTKIDYKPLVFETMVFDPPDSGQECYCELYPTWDEAVEGHKKAIEWVKNGCKDEDAENQ